MERKYKSLIFALPLLIPLAILQPGLGILPDVLSILLHGRGDVPYRPRILSSDPLIIYVQDFMTAKERRGIVAYAKGKLAKSTVLRLNGSTYFSEMRTSSSAMVPRNQSDLAGVLRRFADLQGFLDTDMIENVQVTHYEKGQQFKNHYDFRSNQSGTQRIRRATTGFAILDATCEDCGTHFPLIETNWTRASGRWCEIVDCAATTLIVKPLPGGLLFWQNVMSDGVSDKRMLHAGLPVSNGYKTGMNIWTDVNLWESPIRHSQTGIMHNDG